MSTSVNPRLRLAADAVPDGEARKEPACAVLLSIVLLMPGHGHHGKPILR